MYLNVRLDAFWRESQGNHIGLITFLPLLLSIKGLSAPVLHSWKGTLVDFECHSTKHAAIVDMVPLWLCHFSGFFLCITHIYSLTHTFVTTLNKNEVLMSFQREVDLFCGWGWIERGRRHLGHYSVKKPIISMLLKLISFALAARLYLFLVPGLLTIQTLSPLLFVFFFPYPTCRIITTFYVLLQCFSRPSFFFCCLFSVVSATGLANQSLNISLINY